MRTIQFSILAIASAFAISTFTGCAKGDTGPQGPTGAAGSSNVTISNTNVPPGSWNASSTTQWYYNISGFSIPSSDVCMVYYSFDNSAFTPLPASNIFYAADQLSFSYATGYSLQLTYYNPGQEAIVSTLYYNIADIPPAAAYNHNVNLKDFSAVSKLPGVRIIHM